MNGIDILLLAALAVIVFFAVRHSVRTKGSCGCSSCSGNCAACSADCPSRRKGGKEK